MSMASKQLSLAGMFLGLCAIGMPASQAADKVAGVINTYELITELRPDSESDFLKKSRDYHQQCAAAAKKIKVAVRPFPVFPPDFFVSRSVHLRDGNSFYNRGAGRAIDHDAMTPLNGCTTTTYETVEVSIHHKGLSRFFFNDEKPGVPPERIKVELADPVEFSMYVLPKTVNGVALKCAAPGSAIDKRIEEACIVDPAVVIAAHPNGRPVDAHGTMRVTRDIHNTALRLRPVSLKVGIKIDPTIFARQ